MTSNQEFLSFPFRPYLAVYLFSTCKNEVIETPLAYNKHLDINLNSPDGLFVRLLCTRKKIPSLTVPGKGFRLTVSIPKFADSHSEYVEDSRYAAIHIDDKTAEIIQEHFDAKFRDHFIAFVSGCIFGANNKRGIKKKAILFFMDTYKLSDGDNAWYTYDQLVKLYERRNTPLKQPIYGSKIVENTPLA